MKSEIDRERYRERVKEIEREKKTAPSGTLRAQRGHSQAVCVCALYHVTFFHGPSHMR